MVITPGSFADNESVRLRFPAPDGGGDVNGVEGVEPRELLELMAGPSEANAEDDM